MFYIAYSLSNIIQIQCHVYAGTISADSSLFL